MKQHSGACSDELREILTFCGYINDRIERYRISEESISSNPDHADLLLMPLCQIGEVVQRSRDALQQAYPDVEWHKISGMRNVIVHGYTQVDASIVYAAVKNDVPALRAFCEDMLDVE